MGEKQDLNITFSGCGFLGIYHLGVVTCLKENAPGFLKRVKCFGGASAGALAAAGLALDINLSESAEYVLRLAKRANSLVLGPLHPNFQVVRTIRRSLEKSLPDNAHELASGRLHISLTRVSDLKNIIVSEFYSKEDLIEALVASSFVPVYSGILPATFRGKYYIDGGISDNLPQHFTEGETITVSPFSGESDICPKENCSNDIQIDLNNTSVQVTLQNLYRCSRAFFPPAEDALIKMCQDGYRDTLRYLKTHYPDTLAKEALRRESVEVADACGQRLSTSTTLSAYHTCSCGDSDLASQSSGTCSCSSSYDSDDEQTTQEGEYKLVTLLNQASEAVTEAELWSCYIIRRILWVLKLPTKPLVLSIQQISYLAEVIVKVLPKVEKTGNSYLDRLLASIYMVVYTYQDKHQHSFRKTSGLALEGSAENKRCWQRSPNRGRASSSSSDDRDEVFRSESDAESSDIEVLGDGSPSDENLADMFTQVFESWSESEILDSREASGHDQWIDVGARFHESHITGQAEEDYVILQGYESDISSILEDSKEELEGSV